MMRDKELSARILELEEQVERLSKDLHHFRGLPDPVGVGLDVAEKVIESIKGSIVRKYCIMGFAQHSSSSLCNALRVGDELIAVDGTPCSDMTQKLILQRMMGKRGSTVKLTARRRPSPEHGVRDASLADTL